MFRRPVLTRLALPLLAPAIHALPFLALVALVASPALAEKGKLRERLTPDVMAVVYPDAERLGPEEGSPPAIAVYKGDNVVAYIFSTLDIVAAPGYSVIPFDVIAGVTPDRRITGAKVIFHREPYVLNDPVRQPQLDTFLAREAGLPLRGGVPMLPPDFVAQATITARLMRAAVQDTARMVLHTRLERQSVTVPTLDVDGFVLKSWNELIADGAVARRRLTAGDVAAAVAGAARAGAPDVALDVPLPNKPDDLYIEIFYGLLTPAAIGGNLLGVRNFEDFRRKIPPGGQAIFMASNGPYDFHGTRHFWEEHGFRFDRVRIVQESRTIGFLHTDYYRLLTGAAVGFQAQQEAGIFVLPASAGLDAVKPWRIELTVNAAGGQAAAFPLEYKLPAAQILMPEEPGSRLGRGVARRPGERRDPRRPSDRADGDVCVPGPAFAVAPRPPPRAQRLFAGGAGMARLDRRRPAFDRQRDQLRHRAISRLRARLLPCRAADGDDRGLYAGFPGADRARRVLRLAVPVRGAPGTSRPAFPRARPAAMEPLYGSR
jgi:transcriptional regulator of nitric oxide reductase